jgi:hypothetical protein
MVRRWLVGALSIVAGSAALWNGSVAEYFGRVDNSWEQSHPIPPPPRVELGNHRVTIESTRVVAPGPGLPAEAKTQQANNNLDVVRHQGRVYLAWRTAPDHFANEATAINVVSSEDEKSWRFEARFHLGHDLREPRLLSLGDQLFLYVSKLGKNPLKFEPGGLVVSERGSEGKWSALEPAGPPGAILWRVRPFEGEALMIAYRGGEHLYSLDREPMTVELWRSPDGRNWRPFSPRGAVVSEGGGSETDFALGEDGSLFAVVRNEAGDASGWGAKLCRAKSGALDVWSCTSDKKKYDSPLVFAHDGEIYVVGRRNLTPSGDYDTSTSSIALLHTIQNELSYITTAKRCSLFRWDREQNRLGFVLDLPSRGDTCFPSALDASDPTHVVIYDYSSNISGPDLPWSAGQRRPTFVYRHELVFTRRDR